MQSSHLEQSIPSRKQTTVAWWVLSITRVKFFPSRCNRFECAIRNTHSLYTCSLQC